MKRSTSLIFGAAILLLLLGAILLAFVWTPYDPEAIDSTATFRGPSLRHLMGTDQLGRDILSILLFGGRSTLGAAIIASILAVLLGGTVGVVTALAKPFLRDSLTSAVTVVLALPALLLALVFAAARGPSTTTAMFAIGLATSASVALVTQSEVAQIWRSPFVLAARLSGGTSWAIIRRHVIRNLIPSLVVQTTGAASIAIVAESTLSYLGLSTPPPTPSWGRMLASTQQYLLVHPIVTLWPALFICLAVLGCNLLGDGLRERLSTHSLV